MNWPDKIFSGIDRVYLKFARPFGRELRVWGSLQCRMVEAPARVKPPRGRILVIAPHPDDESIGCAGTLLSLDERAGTIDFLLVTGGDYGPDSARGKELCASLDILNITRVHWLSGRDRHLAEQPDLADEMRRVLTQCQPQHVFLPWFMDGHLDHRLTNHIFLEAAEGVLDRTVQVWGYEVWSPCAANAAVDISTTAAGKALAIACHKSQNRSLNYGEAALGLNRYRALQINWKEDPDLTHAEAFLRLPWPDYRQLALAWFKQGIPRKPNEQ